MNFRNSRAEKSLFAYGLHPGTRIAAHLTDAEATHSPKEGNGISVAIALTFLW
jgi:hypothetical protein